MLNFYTYNRPFGVKLYVIASFFMLLGTKLQLFFEILQYRLCNLRYLY